MDRHISHKRLAAAFLDEISRAEDQGAIKATLRRYCHEDVAWEIFHPFNRLDGIDQGAETFWWTLKESFPDYEHSLMLVLGGEYERRDMVSTLGHLQGTFVRPWLGIPGNHRLTYLRFGMNCLIREGRIAKAYILLDVVDVMRQAGFYPFRQMPGSAEQWPSPPAGTGVSLDVCDLETGAATFESVRQMQTGLGKMDLKNLQNNVHSPRWDVNMNWYGPAGIGSARGKRGFREHHSALFLRAFPDRGSPIRDPEGPQDAPGHYIRLGDGQFAVTSGWPSVQGTHLGDGWLGLPPTGKRVSMRVADWYRVKPDGFIIENWVAIDILDIVRQMGLDVLGDLHYFADMSRRRWPD